MAGSIANAIKQIGRTLGNQGRTVENIARGVQQNTPTIQDIERTGQRVTNPGLSRANRGVATLQREAVPRLQTSANNIARDVTNNGLETEKLREMLQRSMNKNAQCCDELSDLGKQNKKGIQANFKIELKNQISIFKNEINVQFNNVTNKITETTSVTNNLIGGLESTFVSNFNSLNISLRAQFGNVIAEITANGTLINEVNLSLRAEISLQVRSVIASLDIAVSTITGEIAGVEATLATIIAALTAIAAQITQFQLNVNIDFAGIVSEILEAQFFIIRAVDGSTYKTGRAITKETNDIASKIKSDLDQINKTLKEIKEEQENCHKELPRRVGEIVSDYVIGESYYRWDSTSTYFCTLIFKFKETNVETYAKVSQLKVRLKQKNEEITDSDIKDLRARAPGLEGLEYTYGRTRAYYVSPDKRFKTSLFSNSREDANFIYQKALSYINDSFDSKNVSYTEKIERQNNTSRKTPLDGIPVNETNYKQPIHQKLFKIVLIVNGISKPITIYQFKH